MAPQSAQLTPGAAARRTRCGEHQPAPVFGGASVSSPWSDAYAPCLSMSRKPGTTRVVRVALDRVLTHAVGREEQQLARVVAVMMAGRREAQSSTVNVI